MPKPTTSKQKSIKLSKVQLAILELARFLEDPSHDRFQVERIIMSILGLEKLK